MDESIDLGYNADYFDMGVRAPLLWKVHEQPHCLLYGSSGSGKSYHAKLILGKIGKKLPYSKVFVLDYKNDMPFLYGCDRYYGYTDCINGLNAVYSIFEARLNGEDKSRTPVFIFIDELVAWINSSDKKEAEDIKKRIGNVLMAGRGLAIFAITSVQRPDSTYFSSGARENYNLVIGLGTLSKESMRMFFSDFKDEMKPCGRGEGYVLYNGSVLKRIIVPTVRNEKKLEFYIRKALTDEQ